VTLPALAIVQARMASTRLPGKVLLPLADGRPILAHVYERAVAAFGKENVVVATPPSDANIPIGEWCIAHGVPCLSPVLDESDVLGRFRAVARSYRWHPESVIVRVTADDPFKSPEAMRRVAAGERLPVEVGAEAFTLAMLDAAIARCDGLTAEQWPAREHITDALFPSRVPSPTDGQCWTVDTPADYERAVERSSREMAAR
jgi:spore coat polysaccharide biosynthesis protein SpsF (cytidylyltransferase family)